jgi:hypothetical protein
MVVSIRGVARERKALQVRRSSEHVPSVLSLMYVHNS